MASLASKSKEEEENIAAGVPALAASATLQSCVEMPAGSACVGGYDFNKVFDFDAFMGTFATQGFQGTQLSLAIDEINRMRNWRLIDDPIREDEPEELKDLEVRKKIKCTIFFGFTSNMISCGNREVIRFLCQHKMIDAIVTTGGGIEEDFMKCFTPHYMGNFHLKGKDLRKQGLNRIGNLIVPNSNYCRFEDFFSPILDAMLNEQKTEGTVWSPSKVIHRMGKEINNEDSVYYWCWKNDIPVFCPALTDGSVGDMIYFHSYKNPGFVLDIAQDIRGINDIALTARKTGMFIVGGGIVKHHICNANLMRNGADFSVFVNTGHAFDGSDSGAPPDEAVSWGKIKMDAKPVKVSCDAALALPLIVSQTFAKDERVKHQ
jgi:deoxyhypusine synthase